MQNKVFLATLGINLLFLASGCLELGFSLVVRSQMNGPSKDGQDAVRNLVYQTFPLTAGIANGITTLALFIFTLVALMLPTRGWLKTTGYLITLCALFTLCLGVYVWVLTLRLKSEFFPTYLQQDPTVQSLIQTSFQCCGYYNSSTPAFVTDSTCPSPAAAALLRGCGTAISSFSNVFIDSVFTALFGIVGIDAILILSIACLLKDRKERQRYRHIDEKSGFRHF